MGTDPYIVDGRIMQRVRFWIMCAIVALVVISGLLLFGVRYWSARPGSLQNILPDDVDMRLDKLTVNETGSGDRTLIIDADTANYYKSEDIFLLQRVRAAIVSGANRYDIVADSGRYEQGRRVVYLTGHIQVSDLDGGVLKCPSLELRFEEGLLLSSAPFCYSTPTVDLDGSAFSYHTDRKVLEVEGRTHVLF